MTGHKKVMIKEFLRHLFSIPPSPSPGLVEEQETPLTPAETAWSQEVWTDSGEQGWLVPALSVWPFNGQFKSESNVFSASRHGNGT